MTSSNDNSGRRKPKGDKRDRTRAALLEAARQLVRDGGAVSVITSKFLGLRRAVLPIAAGAEGMSMAPFAVASAISAALWSAAFLVPGLLVCAFMAR